MGNFGGNGEEGRRCSYRLPKIDHGEASAVNRRWDVGDARGGSSVRSGRNAVKNDIYRETEGNRGTVGSVTTDI